MRGNLRNCVTTRNQVTAHNVQPNWRDLWAILESAVPCSKLESQANRCYHKNFKRAPSKIPSKAHNLSGSVYPFQNFANGWSFRVNDGRTSLSSGRNGTNESLSCLLGYVFYELSMSALNSTVAQTSSRASTGFLEPQRGGVRYFCCQSTRINF